MTISATAHIGMFLLGEYLKVNKVILSNAIELRGGESTGIKLNRKVRKEERISE